MKIGSLGDIVFEVSEKTIRTIRDASWSGSASIQLHERHLGSALAEFTGSNADTFSFSITVSKFLGADPMDVLSKIAQYEQNGTALLFMLGTTKYGRYRWIISKHTATLEHYDKAGNLASVDIKITLTEYTKE